MRPAIEAEKAGIPSVTIAATNFLPLVRSLAESEGLPNLRAAEYPGAFSVESKAAIKEKVGRTTSGQIIEALTKPAESPKAHPMGVRDRGEAVLTATLEEIEELFRSGDLTDGLAIIPPTIERVEEFLKYTNRSPDEEIAILRPGNLRATPMNIAANGVMAGCRPEFMPVLITAVEAIADPFYNLEQLGTTGGIIPFLLINGPIIKQLGFKYGIGLVSRGPNPAIGRALGLIIRNIANFRPGEQYMGTFGYPLPFVLVEDEENSPWEPFHVEHGFEINTSTVTAGGSLNWGMQGYPSGTDPEGQLRAICLDIVKRIDPYAPILLGNRQMLTVLITPNVAHVIARAGYSKKDVETYFFENSKVSIGEISFLLKHAYATGGTETIQGLMEKGAPIPREWGTLGPDDEVPAMGFPGLVNVVVCGDLTRNKTMALHSPYIGRTTKAIRLPADWDERMQKLGYPALQSFCK